MLHYVHFDSESAAITPLARFQLHTAPATAGAWSAGTSAFPPRRPLHKPWRVFDFVAGRPGEVLILQRASGRVLYAQLPRAEGAAAAVFLFGSHTGARGGGAANRAACYACALAVACGAAGWGAWRARGRPLPLSCSCLPSRCHTADVTCLDNNGAIVAAGGADGAVLTWRLSDGQLVDSR